MKNWILMFIVFGLIENVNSQKAKLNGVYKSICISPMFCEIAFKDNKFEYRYRDDTWGEYGSGSYLLKKDSIFFQFESLKKFSLTMNTSIIEKNQTLIRITCKDGLGNHSLLKWNNSNIYPEYKILDSNENILYYKLLDIFNDTVVVFIIDSNKSPRFIKIDNIITCKISYKNGYTNDYDFKWFYEDYELIEDEKNNSKIFSVSRRDFCLSKFPNSKNDIFENNHCCKFIRQKKKAFK